MPNVNFSSFTETGSVAANHFIIGYNSDVSGEFRVAFSGFVQLLRNDGLISTGDSNANAWGFVIDEDNMVSNSNQRVPTQQSVKAYVDANSGGGDISSSDTNTSGWGFVLDEDDMSSNSATKLPTQQSVKAYIDNNFTNNSDSNVNSKSWVIDEDNMSSNSDQKVPTQQSVKRFVELQSKTRGIRQEVVPQDEDIFSWFNAGDGSNSNPKWIKSFVGPSYVTKIEAEVYTWANGSSSDYVEFIWKKNGTGFFTMSLDPTTLTSGTTLSEDFASGDILTIQTNIDYAEKASGLAFYFEYNESN